MGTGTRGEKRAKVLPEQGLSGPAVSCASGRCVQDAGKKWDDLYCVLTAGRGRLHSPSPSENPSARVSRRLMMAGPHDP
jgi:hypothetical protein